MQFLSRFINIFRRRKSSPPTVPATPKDGPLLAFVALNHDWLASSEIIEARLKEFLEPDPGFTELEFDDGTATFKVRDQVAAIALLPVPIPWTDLEGPCVTSWLWPKATAQMRNHKAQLLITLLGSPRGRLDGAITLTKIAAAMVEAHDTAGVYWSDGTLVVSPEMFVDVARTATSDNPPIPIWVEHRVQKNSDETLNLITTGLAPFGCMEIEILHSQKKFEDLLNLAAGIAHLQLQGDIFRDGDTVGFDAITKLKTSHQSSVWDRPNTVLRIDG